MSRIDFKLFSYELPLKYPLHIGKQILKKRSGYLIKCTDAGGNSAFGDMAPLPGLQPSMTNRRISCILDTLHELSKTEDPGSFMKKEADHLPAAACFAITSAQAWLNARKRGIPLKNWFSASAGDRIMVNALLWGDRQAVIDRTKESLDSGYTCLKLKVGRRDMAEEIRLVNDVCELVSGRAGLRLDANASWTLQQAIQFAAGIKDVKIEYIEEPLQDPSRLPAFFEKTGLGYGLDENLLQFNMPPGRIPSGCRALVLKPSLLGDVSTTGKYIELAGKLGCAAVLSDTFHSGVGVYVTASLAAGCPAADSAAGLDTYTWLADDLLRSRFRIEGGTMALKCLEEAVQDIDHTRINEVDIV